MKKGFRDAWAADLNLGCEVGDGAQRPAEVGDGEGDWGGRMLCIALAASAMHGYERGAFPQIGWCPWRARITKWATLCRAPSVVGKVVANGLNPGLLLTIPIKMKTKLYFFRKWLAQWPQCLYLQVFRLAGIDDDSMI